MAIEYVSPSNVDLYYSDWDAWYLRYVLGVGGRAQDKYMAVGSGFDAYVKAWLISRLGLQGPKWEELFESQVEPQMRDVAREEGKKVWEMYVESGALADLMVDLSGAEDIGFETAKGIRGVVDGVPWLGKPDAWFTRNGDRFVLDWKVNSWFAKSRVSPKPGYVGFREVGYAAVMHPKCQPLKVNGVTVNVNGGLCGVDAGWCDQLTVYGMLLNASVLMVDQVLGKRGVTQYRYLRDPGREVQVKERGKEVWAALQGKLSEEQVSRGETLKAGLEHRDEFNCVLN